MPAMCNVIQDMLVVWDEWKEFPDVSDFDMVKRLHQAKKDVAAMQSQMENKYIEQEIEEYRKEIKESQEKIAKLEKELNEICEKAADGMNLLEEHGVKIDLDAKKSDNAYDGTIEGYADDLSINHAYPGQGIMIEPPPSGTFLSSLPPEAFQLGKEELEEFQKEWSDLSPCLTVYNGTGISTRDASNAINSVCTSLSCAS
jgi:polyribonucleotide nucleotidyltransferase